MKTINLANGKGVAIVDDEDYDELSKFRWYLLAPKRSRVVYANAYIPKPSIVKAMTMHVMVMGRRAGYEVDHIDGNGLNNQRSNLRFATRGQNMANARVPKSNKTGFRGIARDSRGGPNPYRAYASVSGKTVYLGSFPTPELAHARYVEAAKGIYGEFARAD